MTATGACRDCRLASSSSSCWWWLARWWWSHSSLFTSSSARTVAQRQSPPLTSVPVPLWPSSSRQPVRTGSTLHRCHTTSHNPCPLLHPTPRPLSTLLRNTRLLMELVSILPTLLLTYTRKLYDSINRSTDLYMYMYETYMYTHVHVHCTLPCASD